VLKSNSTFTIRVKGESFRDSDWLNPTAEIVHVYGKFSARNPGLFSIALTQSRSIPYSEYGPRFIEELK
jgi:hypothetical protein